MFFLILSVLLLCSCNKDMDIKAKALQSVTYDDDVQVAKAIKSYTMQSVSCAPAACTKIASLHIHQASVVEALQSFAHKHNLQLTIHTDIHDHKINYHAVDKEILDILSDLCQFCKWKLSFSANSMFINKDIPYLHMHKVNILNTNGKSRIKTGVNIEDTKNTNALNIDSSASVETSTSNNLWAEIETFLTFLIDSHANDIDENTDDVTITNNETDSKHSHSQAELLTELAKLEQAKIKDKQMQVHDIMDAEPNTNTNSNDNMPTLATTTVQTASNVKKNIISYSINKQAGLIILQAPQYIHKQVSEYLYNLESKMSSQVKIEARIIQIELSDKFQMGINWSSLAGGSNDFNFHTDGISDTLGAQGSMKVATSNNKSLQGIISALQTYGHTHVISKPELTVLNNEIGLFKVITNHIYFQLRTLELLRNNLHSSPDVIRSSDAKVVPTGFSMSVQPSIDSHTGDMLMHIRPTITAIASHVSDPAVQLSINKDSAPNIKSDYPITTSKEFDTKLKLKAGQWAILGGYIIESKAKRGSGMPGVKSIIGSLFGNKIGEESNSEIVCILRAYPENGNITPLHNRLLEIYNNNN